MVISRQPSLVSGQSSVIRGQVPACLEIERQRSKVQRSVVQTSLRRVLAPQGLSQRAASSWGLAPTDRHLFLPVISGPVAPLGRNFWRISPSLSGSYTQETDVASRNTSLFPPVLTGAKKFGCLCLKLALVSSPGAGSQGCLPDIAARHSRQAGMPVAQCPPPHRLKRYSGDSTEQGAIQRRDAQNAKATGWAAPNPRPVPAQPGSAIPDPQWAGQGVRAPAPSGRSTGGERGARGRDGRAPGEPPALKFEIRNPKSAIRIRGWTQSPLGWEACWGRNSSSRSAWKGRSSASRWS